VTEGERRRSRGPVTPNYGFEGSAAGPHASGLLG
jgi:hypothetical protein